MSSWTDESRFSTVLAATEMISCLEGFDVGAAGGGELFWSLLEPVLRSLVPFRVNERVLFDLGVAGSVGVSGVGDKLSLR